MSFFGRKKKLRFSVTFEIEELTSVSFVSGVLYCKARLLDGGSFQAGTPRLPVQNHMVKWNAQFPFQAKMNANASTGLLEDCICKVSVRKEVKGGKSHEKLGFASINLAEFAGSGKTSRRFILEGYTAGQRQDNSVLKVNLDMILVEGDPMFKVPTSRLSMAVGINSQILEPSKENKLVLRMHSMAEESVDSITQGAFERLSSAGSIDREVLGAVGISRHRRTGSGASNISCDSDLRRIPSAKLTLGRLSQASTLSSMSTNESEDGSSDRVSSNAEAVGSTEESNSVLPPSAAVDNKVIYCCEHDLVGRDTAQPLPLDFGLDLRDSIMHRLQATEVSAEDVVDKLLTSVDLTLDDSLENSGLQLFVGQDGSAIVSGSRRKGNIQTPYKRVVVDKM